MAAEKIRILIVDDIAETRENITKLLQFEPDVEVVGNAGTGREAIEQANILKPDVILMDINMPDMDGIAATDIIRQKTTWVQIVILSVQGDPNYMRKAMQAGASDFLTKPPTIDELLSAIRRAGSTAFLEKEKSNVAAFQNQMTGTGPIAGGAPSPTLGKIISVYSPKGGTGVTTLATNLAVTLQNDETPTVIIDGNLLFGNVSIFFNAQGKNHVGDLTPRVKELDPNVVSEVMISHPQSRVSILAAPTKAAEAEVIRSEDFGQLLNFLRRMYSYIIVDTPSSLTDIALAAFDVSDMVILVTTQDIPSIANARKFLDISHSIDLTGDSILFVMNRYDKRINITPESIGTLFKKEVAAVIPLDSRSVVPAVNRGVPFMVEHKRRGQPAAKAVLSLAETIRRRVTEAEEQYLEPSRSKRR